MSAKIIWDNPELAEAFRHGRTQESLTLAVGTLRRIYDICCQRRGRSTRITRIAAEARVTLRLLSEANGGVIDDVSPLSSTVNSPSPDSKEETEGGK